MENNNILQTRKTLAHGPSEQQIRKENNISYGKEGKRFYQLFYFLGKFKGIVFPTHIFSYNGKIRIVTITIIFSPV